MSWKLKFDEEKRLERAALKKRAPDANKLSGMCGWSHVGGVMSADITYCIVLLELLALQYIVIVGSITPKYWFVLFFCSYQIN